MAERESINIMSIKAKIPIGYRRLDPSEKKQRGDKFFAHTYDKWIDTAIFNEPVGSFLIFVRPINQGAIMAGDIKTISVVESAAERVKNYLKKFHVQTQ
jgi:hypothetical protein